MQPPPFLSPWRVNENAPASHAEAFCVLEAGGCSQRLHRDAILDCNIIAGHSAMYFQAPCSPGVPEIREVMNCVMGQAARKRFKTKSSCAMHDQVRRIGIINACQ